MLVTELQIHVCIAYNINITGVALRELNITRNDIGDIGMSVIKEGLYSNKQLIELDVSWCNLSVRGTTQNVFLYLMNDR